MSIPPDNAEHHPEGYQHPNDRPAAPELIEYSDITERIARALSKAAHGTEEHWRAHWQDALLAVTPRMVREARGVERATISVDPTKWIDPEAAAHLEAMRKTLSHVDLYLAGGYISPLHQLTVALLAATNAVKRHQATPHPAPRGKLINAAVEDFRKMLQRELPLL